jgi:hypothetical protein
VYNKLVSNNSLDQALEGYQQLLNNKYPQEISQNIELKNKIEICRQLVVKKEIEDEKIRIVEEARQEKIRLVEEAREERMRIAEEARQEKIRIAEERQKAKKDAQEFKRLMIILGTLNQVKEKLDNPYGRSSSSSSSTNNSRTSSNYSNSSQGQQKKCSTCSGTGRCRTCGKAQQDGYYNRSGSYIRINEIRPGMTICDKCHGRGTFGSDYNSPCGWCKGQGWEFCRTCNYSGRGSYAGQCQTCKGSGVGK